MNAYREPVDSLQALGDATRRAIIECLRGGERTVGDLAASLPVSRPAVSQHLSVLRAAGLVLERPAGTRRWYRLDPIGLVRLQERLEAMWGLEATAMPEPAAALGSVRPDEPSDRTERDPRTTTGSSSADAPAKGERKKHKKKSGRK